MFDQLQAQYGLEALVNREEFRRTIRSASIAIAGIELAHMIRKGQVCAENDAMMTTPAETFYSLAA